MFDGFTDRGRRVVALACEEARIRNQDQVGTEHLLLGLIEEAGPAALALVELGVDVDAVQRSVAGLLATGADPPERWEFVLTPAATRVVARARRAAAGLEHAGVGDEHLLLGLVSDVHCDGAQVLLEHGADLARARLELMHRLVSTLDGDEPAAVAADRSFAAGGEAGVVGLDEVGYDLTRAATGGRLDPVAARDGVVDRVMTVLARRTRNNPLLLGEPGVGKTAVVEGLALRIAEGRVPDVLADLRVFEVDLARLLAGTRYRGDFERRLRSLLAEARERGNVVLFLDEFHTLVGAGTGEGSSIDATAILKPALAAGDVRVIGATTPVEHHRHVEPDAALARRLAPVLVAEPTVPDTVEMLNRLRSRYEQHHQVLITAKALTAAASLGQRYLPGRRLPDKAVDLIDEASARARNAGAAVVDEPQVADVLAAWTGIPVGEVGRDEADRLRHLEDDLGRRVVGQDEAVSAVSRAVRRARAGLRDPRRPSGGFLFAGPSGVGKTHLARVLAELVFGDERALVRTDLSEYQEPVDAARLTGAPPGYVGYDEAGGLTEQVRRQPFSVVLFDEVDKAHPEAVGVLLQILEEGTLTDGQGRTADFSNTVVVLTSNLGSAAGTTPTGFGTVDDDQTIRTAVQQHLPPELLNRLDDVIVFHRLTEADQYHIIDLMIEDLRTRLPHDLGLHVTPEARAHLIARGTDPAAGARPLRRAVEHELADPIAEHLLHDQIRPGQTLVADRAGAALTVRAAPQPA